MCRSAHCFRMRLDRNSLYAEPRPSSGFRTRAPSAMKLPAMLSPRPRSVSRYRAPGGRSASFVRVGGQMFDLDTLLAPGSGFTIRSADGINASGQIAATGTNARGQTRALLPTPIPDAASAPVLRLRGKKRLTKTHSRLILCGTSTDAIRVESKAGKSRFKKAKGTAARWKIPPHDPAHRRQRSRHRFRRHFENPLG